MMFKLLKEMSKNNYPSIFVLARSLDLDQETVRQMFNNLERMGYIELAGGETCEEKSCSGCFMSCDGRGSSNTIKRWKLTAKGEKAVSIE